MAEVSLNVEAPLEAVWAVLADGWSYAGWVVGASHIRDVDTGWPEPGTRIHHSVGPWPMVVQDVTEVVRCEPSHLLELDARLWPAGAARITFTLRPRSESLTEVLMVERVVRGPSAVLPNVVQDLMLTPRNKETLQRLNALAKGRAAPFD
ncbi:Polyketide cyclase / dehydrase and lipid transport [Lentzea albidocapillata subsp. violacea]|uniref:Polyketide cyclase / dehydrase and lipid transport n=1 Tax=Lentzea albidocapillata subsp. violacea TaxID=128104 RepID=A0A1G9EV64_9PSEU|nr:SRPBCC family protein [Lentzea albidocapillata]SDK79971.1 Polyketide cyclase / dehydrase and lipid transport [Lentzea albidocapillata subsp. violacea]